MKELVKKIRRYEIQIRKAINSQMQGDFHSIFKGSGLEYDDVRQYQYGDDIRAIDWNVSAKGHGTFVKRYKETKEQTVMFMVDVSGSQEIGSPGKQKIDVGKEICGVLSMTALKESSMVGMICFSDQRERYVKPAKGLSQAYEIISNLFNLVPKSTKTNINQAIVYALNVLKKRSVVIIISDFIDDNYEHSLKALAQRHDLVLIQINDKRETNVPSLGIVPVFDKENRKTLWVNTSSSAFKSHLNSTYQASLISLENLSKRFQINHLKIDTEENYIPKLIKLFKVRNKTLKRV